jgi:hypothetical protein
MGSCHKTKAAWLLLSGLALAATAVADEWDVGADADNAFTTDNLVAHGAEQVHDLTALPGPVPDQDWFLAPTHPFSSYQFAVDGTTGELDLVPPSVQRLNDNGGTVVESALVTDFGGALSLGWLGPAGVTSTPVLNWVRVQGASCGTACGSQDRYRARFHDTTYTIPRFNNSGTQATVLLIQNASGRGCTVVAYYFGVSGAFLDTSSSLGLAPQELMIVNTAVSVPNQSGSVRVAHTCGYGGLAGKAVAVEPATGFTFDTAMEPRP